MPYVTTGVCYRACRTREGRGSERWAGLSQVIFSRALRLALSGQVGFDWHSQEMRGTTSWIWGKGQEAGNAQASRKGRKWWVLGMSLRLSPQDFLVAWPGGCESKRSQGWLWGSRLHNTKDELMISWGWKAPSEVKQAVGKPGARVCVFWLDFWCLEDQVKWEMCPQVKDVLPEDVYLEVESYGWRET